MKGLLPLTLILGILLLSACTSSGGKITTSTTVSSGDGPPDRDIDASRIPDAVPKLEPIVRAGNKSPYTVLGKTYHLLPAAKGYSEEGIGSWYGKKFHGRKTSNGETYDMYTMTAAHKTLPIPAYVKVTNLDNNRSAIVRVNDRGPFHDGRIIDLSYAAAKKLDYANMGTARVRVEAIDPAVYQANSVERPHVASNIDQTDKNRVESPAYKPVLGPIKPSPTPVAIGQNKNSASVPPTTTETYRLPGNTFLQVGAFSSLNAAETLQTRVAASTARPTAIREGESTGDTLFRVLVGPFSSATQLRNIREALMQSESLQPFVVYDSMY